ncbi:MAG: hypothetical protein FWG68_04910 [Defluviitaleaceae bacterium]|nr:hypothetical protein [Defluviitaleaceae bacterium]
MGMPEFIVPVDEHTRDEFNKLCASAGMTAPKLLGMFVRNTVQTKKVPFNGEETAVQAAEQSTEKPAKREKTIRERVEARAKARANGEFTQESAIKAVAFLRQEAQRNGTSTMTMDEINAEIALSRKERREQCAMLAELRAATPWIDKSGLREIDDMFSDEVEMEIEEYRKMGYEVAVNG